MNRIYLDYAATTPARPEAIAAMLPLLGEFGYNPSSMHGEGRAARAALDAAREIVARALGATPREVVFTASGSESVGLAVVGAAQASAVRGRHIVTCDTEHHAVLRAVEGLELAGWSATRLPVDADGRIDPAAFGRALRPDTTIASIMLANNETGTIAPIAQLAAIAHRAGVLFHTDAIAAPCVAKIDVAELGVDLLSLAGHKFFGPKGAGVLYVKRGTPLTAQVTGGGQEHGLRAGTENVAAIAGLAAALEMTQSEADRTAQRLGELRDRLEAGICATIPGVRLNGAGAPRQPNISSVAFRDAPADALLIALDLAGIAASAGSACAAGSLEPSHVATALGLPPEFVRGVVRFSLGAPTTAADIAGVLAILPQLVSVVRGSAAVV